MPEEASAQDYERLRAALSTWCQGQYEFTGMALRNCHGMWLVSADQLRGAIVQHFQSRHRLYKKWVDGGHADRRFFHANVLLSEDRDIYVELSIREGAPVRVNAHNHHRFPILER